MVFGRFSILKILCIFVAYILLVSGIFLFLTYKNSVQFIADNEQTNKSITIDHTADIEKQLQETQIKPFFVKNEGQAPEGILYYFQGKNRSVYFTKDRVIFQNNFTVADSSTDKDKSKMREVVYHMIFMDLDNSAQLEGEEMQETKINYFVGGAKQTNIPAFGRVVYKDLYPNIDLEFFFKEGVIKYDVIVHPGGDLKKIKLQFDGVKAIKENANGDLIVMTSVEEVVHKAPLSFQQERQKIIESSYILNVPKKQVSFNIATYNLEEDLIIDPALSTLSASTFLGGSDSDTAPSIAIDNSGNIYIAAQTISANFPTTAGVYDTTHNGGTEDIVISKLNSSLSTLSASTFLGSDSSDSNPIIISNSDNIFIVGSTASSSFPTTVGAYDVSHNGASDIFISKFSSNLQNLLSSTFMGGTNSDTPVAMMLDTSQNIYIVGQPGNESFPTTTGAYDTSGDASDGFIAKISSDFASLLASTYFGGSSNDSIEDMVIDSSGNVIVSGGTSSNDFPTTVGAYDTIKNGTYNVFVSKFNSDLTSLISSTYLGGTGDFFPLDTQISVDTVGRIYIFGHTASTDFPTSTGAYDTSQNGSDDWFISQFNSSLSTLSGGTYVGGSGYDSSVDLVISSSNLFAAGRTAGADFPTTAGVYDTSHNGSNDIVVAKFSLNTPPTLTTSTPTQTTATIVTVSTTLTDADSNITSLIVEHSTNGTNWTSSTLSSVTPSEGAVTTATGQVSGIDTDLDGAVQLTILWNIEADLPNTATSTVYLRFIPNDGTENGTVATTSVFTIDTADPTVPGNLSVATLSSSTISFNFPSATSTDTNFSEYKIHYSTSTPVVSSTSALTSSTDPNLGNSNFNAVSTSVALTGLTPNTLYYFNLFAYDSWGYSTSSLSEVSTTTRAAIPLTLSSSLITQTAVTLSWLSNSNPAGTEYYLANEANGTMNSGWITTQNYEFTGLNCGSSYSFQVKARTSASRETDWSSSGGVSTNACNATLPPVAAPVPPPPEVLPLEVLPELEPKPEPCPLGTLDPACVEPEINQPTGLIAITNGSTVLQYTTTNNITLKLDATYADKLALKESTGSPSEDFSGVSFESISATKAWILSNGDGKKCINARFMDTLKGFTYTTYACVTLDTTAPYTPHDIVFDTRVVDGIRIAKPKIRGKTSEPYLTIIIRKILKEKFSLAADTTYYTKSDAQGNWEFTFATFFDPGIYRIEVQTEDYAGNISVVQSTDITIPTDREIMAEKNKRREEEVLQQEEKTVLEDRRIKPQNQTQEKRMIRDQVIIISRNTNSSNRDVSPVSVDTSSSGGSSGGSSSDGGSGGNGGSGGIIESAPIETGTVATDVLVATTAQILTTSIEQTISNMQESIKTSVAGVTQAVTRIKATLAPLAQQVQVVMDNPQVEQTNEIVIAPTIAVATAANVATSFGMTQLLVYLRFFFTQPLMLFGMRRRKKWGVVYNGFTKQPIDLALLRLLDAKTGKIIETQVSDTKGRYVFVSNPGEYRLEVSKPGYVGWSQHLKEMNQDAQYTDLYHGELISLTSEQTIISAHIPLDPDGTIIPTKKLLKLDTRKMIQRSLSSVSVCIAFISLLISPTLFIALILGIHILVYIIFHYLSQHKLGKNFGTIFHKDTHKTLKHTVIRIFEAQYNRLIDTKISNSKGRYVALVGAGTYVVMYEKPEFQVKQVRVSIAAREKSGGVIARNEGLVRLKD